MVLNEQLLFTLFFFLMESQYIALDSFNKTMLLYFHGVKKKIIF
jgi:hypothetical protein